MPTWNLRLPDGKTVAWLIPHYKTDDNGVVLSFAVELTDGTSEICVLVPSHYQQSKIPNAIENALRTALDLAGAGVAYKLGSAHGVKTGIVAGAVGLVATEMARIVATNWFSDKVVDGGDYYDRFGQKVIEGLLTMKKT